MVSAVPAVWARSRTTLCFFMRAKQGGAKQTKGCSTTRLRRFGRNDIFFFAAFSFRQLFHSGNIFIHATFSFRQHFHSCHFVIKRKPLRWRGFVLPRCCVIPIATHRAGWRRFRCAAPGTSVPVDPPGARRPADPRSWPCPLRRPWRRRAETPPHLPPC